MSDPVMEKMQSILASVDLAKLIGSTERETGRRTWVCPFCGAGKGLKASAEFQSYHCFSCGAGGNAIRWAMDRHRLSKDSALEFLRDLSEWGSIRA